jgi:hypothetical protein
MKIGIMQGRLVKPFNGHIQEFPIDNWKDEFLFNNKNSSFQLSIGKMSFCY